MNQRGIQVTGNRRVDQATAEIAVALRDASPGKPDQHYYDEAARLRDEILCDPGSDEAVRAAWVGANVERHTLREQAWRHHQENVRSEERRYQAELVGINHVYEMRIGNEPA